MHCKQCSKLYGVMYLFNGTHVCAAYPNCAPVSSDRLSFPDRLILANAHAPRLALLDKLVMS